MATPLRDREAELYDALNQLSLNTPPPPPAARSPRTLARSAPQSLSPAPSRAPSRSPSAARDPARAATPALLRKASSHSLRSVSGQPSTPVAPSPGGRQRRSSVQHAPASSSPLGRYSSASPERPEPTASSVAREYFAAELDALHGEASGRPSETVVILHDDCYGHRFARPRTTRTALGMVVERPERIKACVMGVAMAYVRLGERHAGGRYAVHPKRDPASVPVMPFRIRKTSRKVALQTPAVTNVHGTDWMEELRVMCDSAEAKLAAGEKELERRNTTAPRGPDEPEPAPLHEGDLYLCDESRSALEGSLGAVCEAVDTVFATTSRRVFVGIRPPGHHCSASHPSGFCWINNVHVGIMHGALSHGLTHAAIVDFDLHHGDGSQAIAWAHNAKANHSLPRNAAAWRRTSIGYFSLHDINSYPCETGDDDKVRNASLCMDNAHGQSVWNVHLQPWKTEDEFWHLYDTRYAVLLDKTRGYLKTQADRLRAASQTPRAAIFLSAGFDASEWEGSGMQRHQVNVPTEFYARMTRDVVRIAAEEGLGVDGRVVSVLEGGYSDRALTSGVCSHLCGLAGESSPAFGGGDGAAAAHAHSLGSEMSHRMGITGYGRDSPDSAARSPSLASPHASASYDPSWWSAAELDRLDGPAPGCPAPPPEKQSRRISPSYCSPTHSSTARAVDPVHLRRSLSGTGRPHSPFPAAVPVPEVPWTVAARELCKLLIPTNRTVDSHKPEELNAEATRARRDRQSMLMLAAGVSAQEDTKPALAPAPASFPYAPPAPIRTSTRERKAVMPFTFDDTAAGTNGKGKGKAGSAVVQAEKAVARGVPSETGKRGGGSRRLSSASTAISAAPPAASESDIGASRPPSASSMRPESSISVRRPAAGGATTLSIRKTRIPTNARKEGGGTAKASRGSKKPAAQPPAGTDPAASSATEDGTASGKPSSAPPAHTAADGDDVDKLVSGVKRIKINILTKAQKEARRKEADERAAREAASVPAERKDGDPPTPSSPPPLRECPSSSPKRVPSLSSSSSVVDLHAEITTPSISDAPFIIPIAPAADPACHAPHAHLGAVPSFFTSSPAAGVGPAASEALYHPAGRRISVSSSSVGGGGGGGAQPPKRTLTASEAASPGGSPGTRRRDPPAFTATSHIPFAPKRADSTESTHTRRSLSPKEGGGEGGGGLVRARAARIAALEAATAGQAAWGGADSGS